MRVLAPAALRPAIESAGLAFEPYRDAPEHDEAAAETSLIRDFETRTPAGAASAARDRLLAGTAGPIAADVLRIVRSRRIDVVVSDYMLFGAAFAAESQGVPAVLLVHTVYPFPRAGVPPFGMGWQAQAGPVAAVRDAVGRWLFRRVYEGPLVPRLNEVRVRLGLTPVGTLDDLIERADRLLVLTSEAFDFAGPLAANARYVGAQLEDAAWTPPWRPPWPADDGRPLVAVGLSTTYQANRGLLERTIEALGSLPVKAMVSTGPIDVASTPKNVYTAKYVPHQRLFSMADVVLTHGGLGTVHTALVHGRPLVCAPLGRDQGDNAARVVARGAGVRIRPGARPAKIAAAVSRVLGDPRYAEGAWRLGAGLTDDGLAVAELVRAAEGRQPEMDPRPGSEELAPYGL